MVLEEVFVRLESGQTFDVHALPNVAEGEGSLNLDFHDAVFGIEEWALIFDEDRLNGAEIVERPSLKLQKLSSI